MQPSLICPQTGVTQPLSLQAQTVLSVWFSINFVLSLASRMEIRLLLKTGLQTNVLKVYFKSVILLSSVGLKK